MSKLNDYMEMARRSTYGAMGSRVPRQYDITAFRSATMANQIFDNWKSFTNMIGRKNPITAKHYEDVFALIDAIPDIIAEMNQIKHELEELLKDRIKPESALKGES